MKRLSSGTWFLISLMLLALGAFFWLWGDRIRAQRSAPAIQPDIVHTNGQVYFPNLGKPKYQLVTQLEEKTLKSAFSSPAPKAKTQGSSQSVVAADPRFPYRLRNTFKTVGDLSKTETAILLNNATIDSSSKVPIWVPDHLRASEETESYLLQSVGPFDQVFDGLLETSRNHEGRLHSSQYLDCSNDPGDVSANEGFSWHPSRASV